MNANVLQKHEQKIRLLWLVTILWIVSIQTALASAKAGEATVYTGSTTTISLAATYQNTLKKATGVTYRWYSENTSLVSVTSSTRNYATIKGISPTSSCRVYFYCSYFIDGFYRTMDFYYTITVKSSTVSVTRVSLNKTSASLTEGETLQLNASVYPTNATNRNVIWSSNNTSVATVTSYGLVTAKSAGSATIVCQAADGSGRYASCRVMVKQSVVNVTSVSLDRSSETLTEGETLQLNASVYPTNATNRNVTWSSDNTSVATVTSYGLVTAKSAGSATITCRAADGSGKYATCVVTVKSDVQPASITLDHSNATLEEGETMQLTADIRPVEASDKTVTWMSDNVSVATVSADGLVTAVSEGEANIIATTSNHLAAVCQVKVVAQEVGVQTDWAGTYTVYSRHVAADPSRDYADNFEMMISQSEDGFIMTSLFGEDLTKYNDGGFRLKDLGNGKAIIDVSYYNILRYTDNDSPLYALYIWDEAADDWSDEWMLTMNDDGSISVGDFYVVAFTWDENEEIWKNGRVEALYYDLLAKKGTTNVETAVADQYTYRIESGAVVFPEPVKLSLYRLNGMQVYSGTTDKVEGLSKGLYIMKIGQQSRKILIN